jgi:adenylate cyclase class IV
MANEIEAKIALVNEEEKLALEKRLTKEIRGVAETVLLNNRVYRAPWMRRGEFVRLRFERELGNSWNGKHSGVTYKGQNVGQTVNFREEINFGLDKWHAETFEEFLKAMRFELYSNYYARRTAFNFHGYDPVVICLDMLNKSCQLYSDDKNFVEDIGKEDALYFVEIEALTENKVLSELKRLGLQDRPIVKESYANIFAGVKENGLYNDR